MSLYNPNPNTNIEVFDFSEALKRIKKGKKVSRRGWNGKSQYIQIVSNVVGYTSSGKVESNKAIGFFGTSGLQIGWLASQADMLAEDWYEVTDSKPSNTITKSKECGCNCNKINETKQKPIIIKPNQNVCNSIKDLSIDVDRNSRNINVTVTADTIEDVYDLINIFKHLS